MFDKIASVFEKKCIYILALEMASSGNQLWFGLSRV